jgi:hypothetical protein
MGGASHLRACAREERCVCLTLILLQKCHPRPLHHNRAARVARTSRAASASPRGRRMAFKSHASADLSVGIHGCNLQEGSRNVGLHACDPRRKAPRIVGRMRRDGSPLFRVIGFLGS